MKTISHGYGKFRTPDWLDGIKILPGVQKTYEWIVMSARGKDYAYPTQEWLAKKVKVTCRSIRNYIRALVKALMIEVRIERIKGKLRHVYYFLAHPAIEVEKAEDDRKNFPVTAENFSAQLDKGKSCTENSPYPPKGEAACAAGESHEFTQTIETSSDAREHSPDLCHTGRMEGENGRDFSMAAEGRMRSDDTKRNESTKGLGSGQSVSQWRQALEILKESVPAGDLDLWLKPLKAGSRSGRFALYFPDQYFASYVERRFFGAIQAALQQAGIPDFSNQDLVVEERISPTIARQQIQKKNQEDCWRKLNSLSSKEQFKALAAAYPRNTCGQWSAWRTFSRLLNQGELPDMAVLLRIINQQKSSAGWNRDNGRWIPGLAKWLKNKPWWNSDCCEKGREKPWATAWRGTSPVYCES
jgi:hypothetical protein